MSVHLFNMRYEIDVDRAGGGKCDRCSRQVIPTAVIFEL